MVRVSTLLILASFLVACQKTEPPELCAGAAPGVRARCMATLEAVRASSPARWDAMRACLARTPIAGSSSPCLEPVLGAYQRGEERAQALTRAARTFSTQKPRMTCAKAPVGRLYPAVVSLSDSGALLLPEQVEQAHLPTAHQPGFDACHRLLEVDRETGAVRARHVVETAGMGWKDKVSFVERFVLGGVEYLWFRFSIGYAYLYAWEGEVLKRVMTTWSPEENKGHESWPLRLSTESVREHFAGFTGEVIQRTHRGADVRVLDGQGFWWRLDWRAGQAEQLAPGVPAFRRRFSKRRDGGAALPAHGVFSTRLSTPGYGAPAAKGSPRTQLRWGKTYTEAVFLNAKVLRLEDKSSPLRLVVHRASLKKDAPVWLSRVGQDDAVAWRAEVSGRVEGAWVTTKHIIVALTESGRTSFAAYRVEDGGLAWELRGGERP